MTGNSPLGPSACHNGVVTAQPFSHYPLAAVASQPQLLLALSLLVIDPSIGGLLIRGDRGAAKSTAARGLAELLPSTPFVNLPLGATEDRIVGTLDLQAALQGEIRLQAGLMAQAHGGVLYIDEVNLLPDHLVDVLLDAAAMGTVRVQRDSLSAESPARFALVGSMNPEEGNLRPQFLDRFGLCVDVHAPLEASARREILRRRMAFEHSPEQFWHTWQPQQDALRERLQAAMRLLPSVQMTGEGLDIIAQQVSAAGVTSLRADLVLYRAARAHAALEGRSSVQSADVLAAAPLALLHRLEDGRSLPDLPASEPPSPSSGPPPSDPPASHSVPPQPPEQPTGPNQTSTDQTTEPHHTAQQGRDSAPAEGDTDSTFAPAPSTLLLRPLAAPARGKTAQISGLPPTSAQATGRLLRSAPDPKASRLHVPDTLRTAITRQAQSPSPSALSLQPQDYRAPIYAPSRAAYTLFVVDSSGSLGLSGQMGLVKGAMLSTLAQSGAHDLLALMVFRGTGAKLILDWTRDISAIEQAIHAVPTGGRTPLAHGLQLAAQHLETVKGGALVLLTDGRANVPLQPGSDAWADALEAAQRLKAYPAQVVDTETGHVRLGRAQQLAQVMGAQLLRLSEDNGA